MDYHEYLASREWQVKRKQIIERGKGICERCHMGQIKQIHHLTYKNLGHEPLNELQGLCAPCHEFLSAKREDDPILCQGRFLTLRFSGQTPNYLDQVTCPLCHFEYVHPYPSIRTETQDSVYTISIPFMGECGHSFNLCFNFHKGETFTSWQLLDDTANLGYYQEKNQNGD